MTNQKTIAVGSTEEDIKVRYTAKTHTSGGRRGGVSHSDDGRLDVMFSAPGVPGTGTNPEQLFAAGWSACFSSAMAVVANKMKVKLPADVAIDAEIDLGNSGDVYFLRARLNVSLPGLEREVAQAIVDATHGETCAYSKATRGNIDVTVNGRPRPRTAIKMYSGRRSRSRWQTVRSRAILREWSSNEPRIMPAFGFCQRTRRSVCARRSSDGSQHTCPNSMLR